MSGAMGSPGECKCPVRCWTGDAGPLQTLSAGVAWMEELVVLWAPRGVGRAGRDSRSGGRYEWLLELGELKRQVRTSLRVAAANCDFSILAPCR